MTKQVANLVNIQIHINESELAFLRLLESKGGSMSLSSANIAKAIGLKDRSAARIAKSLSNKGLIFTQERFLGNGAQLENEYVLTSQGREVLKAAAEAEAAEAAAAKAAEADASEGMGIDAGAGESSGDAPVDDALGDELIG